MLNTWLFQSLRPVFSDPVHFCRTQLKICKYWIFTSELLFSLILQSNNNQQWLQIDLLQPKKITGIITQGAKSMYSEMYVKTFSILYSDDGSVWKPYMNDSTSMEKVPILHLPPYLLFSFMLSIKNVGHSPLLLRSPLTVLNCLSDSILPNHFASPRIQSSYKQYRDQ